MAKFIKYCQHVTHFPSTCHILLFSTLFFHTGQPDVTAWQDQLKAIYKTRRGGIGFIPGFPKKFSSDEFFVELKLLEKQELPMQVKHVELKTYTDLLQLTSTQGKSLDHVLVSGLAGTGKTTLISRLAYQWATFQESSKQCHKDSSTSAFTEKLSPEPPLESYDYLGNFQLVFALDIRKFQPDQDLIDAVREQLLPHVSKETLRNYLSCHSSSCLFLFDGYDEIGSNTKILSDNMICGFHTIVTTRPKAASGFNDAQRGYVQVSLEGFSQRSIEEFVRSFFRLSYSNSGYEVSFLEALRNNETIYNLSHFPLMLSMMCVLWKQEKSLPNLVTVLYKKIMEYLVRHWKSRELSNASVSKFKEQVALDNLLLKLGQTALHGLVDDNSKLIFQENDFESTDTLEKGCSLGLMMKDCTEHEFDMVTTVSFIHKTFQEYCAALYLASLAESDQDLCNTYISKMDTKDMENVLKFTCGMNVNAAKVVLSFLVDQSCERIKLLEVEGGEFGIGYLWYGGMDPWRLPLILLFEVESQFGFNKSLHELLIPLVSSIHVVNGNISDSEYRRVLQYYIKQADNPHAWMCFVVKVCLHMGSEYDDWDLLLLTGLSNLHTITVQGHNYSFDCSSLLLEIQNDIASHLIKVLEFDRCKCDIASIKVFLDTQPNLITISSLTLDQLEANDDPANGTILRQVLQEVNARSGSITEITLMDASVDDLSMQNVGLFCHSLQTLHVHSTTNITPVGFQVLFEAMITAGQKNMVVHSHHYKEEQKLKAKSLPLKYLNLKKCNIGTSAYTLANAMVYLTSLAYLDLSDCNLDEKQTLKVCSAFEHLPNLATLDFSNNIIGNSFQAFAQGINLKSLNSTYLKEESNITLPCRRLPLLTELKLQDAGVTSDGVIGLSKSLMHMPLLNLLDLSNNMIGSHGAQALSASLQYIPQLTLLNLSKNNIGSDGAQALSASLQYIPQLTSLHLYINNIGSDGAQALSASLKYIPQLTWLDLSNNNIGSDGAQALSASLQYIPQLTRLALSNNNIGSDGAQALSASLQYIPQLTFLYLSNNNIGSDGAQALSASLQYIPKLEELHLFDNNIGSDGAQALSASRQFLPKLRILWLHM